MKKKKITEKTKIGEIIQKHPETVEILLERGFHCFGCHISQFETLEEGAAAHGIGKNELKKIISEMNQKISKKRK